MVIECPNCGIRTEDMRNDLLEYRCAKCRMAVFRMIWFPAAAEASQGQTKLPL